MEKEYYKLLKLAEDIHKHFPAFYLAGGTALMLKYKHRLSIDLDFFNQNLFSFARLSTKIKKLYRIESEQHLGDNIDFFIGETRVSFVFFPFKNIEPLESFSKDKTKHKKEFKIASDYDLFLNKIYVAGRRIDPKDPSDAAFLYKKYGWKKEKIKSDFEKKFLNQSFEIYLGALLHFEDYPKLPKWVSSTLMKLIE